MEGIIESDSEDERVSKKRKVAEVENQKDVKSPSKENGDKAGEGVKESKVAKKATTPAKHRRSRA
jgi:hypothetical protein